MATQLSRLGMLAVGRCSGGTRHRLHLAATVAAGHSHWQNVAGTKAKKDHARSVKANAIVRKIALAVKRGGSFDPAMNNELARCVKEAQDAQVSSDTVKRTLKRLKDVSMDKSYVYVKGPSGTFFIIEFFSFDRITKLSRSVSRHIRKVAPNLLQPATDDIKLYFQEKGIILTAPGYAEVEDETKKRDAHAFRDSKEERLSRRVSLEEMQEVAIDVEAEEVAEAEDDDGRPGFELITDLHDLAKVESGLREKGILIREADTGFVPLHFIQIPDAERDIVGKFYEALMTEEDLTKIYTNIA